MTNSRRFLIIEDDRELLGLLSTYILKTYAGSSIVLIDNGRYALEYLKAVQFQGIDLIICDLIMPGVTGFNLLVEIPNDSTKILVITAQQNGCEVVDRILAAHPEKQLPIDCLLKPFFFQEMKKRMDQLLL